MGAELTRLIPKFKSEFLNTPLGEQSLSMHETEPEEVVKVWNQIKTKRDKGQDYTDDVLRRLLPHVDSASHRENGYRVSTWPCIMGDVREWFQGAGWRSEKEWPAASKALVEAVEALLRNDTKVWKQYLESPYHKGFAAGFISPVLYCLDRRFPVINSKVVKTFNLASESLGKKETISASLDDYIENAEKVHQLVADLKPHGISSLVEFDVFCHWLVAIEKHFKSGRGPEPSFVAWLFVANPKIYQWDQAFDENGVEWTGSLNSVSQKHLREHVHDGQRVFGYQARPDFCLYCEMRTVGEPYKTAQGTMAVNLKPVRKLDNPVPLSILKRDPVLSSVGFIRHSQVSISGLTAEHLGAIERLIGAVPIEPPTEPPSPPPTIGPDAIFKALKEAQHDTGNPTQFEALLAKAFQFLGLEAEHIGGPGKADVLVKGSLGPKSFSAVVDGKTAQKAVDLGRVDFDSINEHRVENSADHAVIVAPDFTGGKLVDRAKEHGVCLLTTEQLLTLLRHHDQYPFSLLDIHQLIQSPGPAEEIVARLQRQHQVRVQRIELTAQIIDIFEEHQRTSDASEPLNASSVYWILKEKTKHGKELAPEKSLVESILNFLSNPVLDILSKEEAGFMLVVTPEGAKDRIAALGSIVGDVEG